MDLERVMTTTYSRRRVLAAGGATVLAGIAARGLPGLARAQGTTDATMGYPAITVTVSDKAIEGPESLPAGLTHVTVKNTQMNGLEHMIWGKFPEGIGKEDVLKLMALPNTATPAPEDQFTEKVMTRLTIVGGPDEAMPDRDAVGIVSFTEGRYMLLNIFGKQPPLFFEVTAPDSNAKTEGPAADISVQMGNMVFVGLDNGVPAGKRLWKVENIDKIWHELAIIPIKATWTEKDVIDFMKSSSDDDGFAFFKSLKGASSIQTPGITSWQIFDIPPGHYCAACFAPSLTDGMPHALMGMVKVFDAK